MLVLAATQGRAQDLEILDRGKPVTGVAVSAGGQTIGTTSSTGHVLFNPNALNVTKGETVEVWVKDCGDGKVEIVLAREGSDDPCVKEGAQAGERCGCREIGAFVVGDGPVTIDIGTGTVTQVRTGETVTGGRDHAFADLQIGAMFDYSSFYNWEDVGCDQSGIASCDAKGGVPGLGLYLDYRFGRSPFGLSLEAHYAKLDFDQTFQSGGNLPSRSEGDVNSWAVQATGVYSHGFSPRLAWYGRAGYALLYNDGKFTSTFGTGPVSESRTNTASQFVIGTGFHFPIGRNWCGRTGVDVTTAFDSENGDENARFSFAVGYRINRE
jgi:uncharacterized cupredoxin-like copper-binding protein